MNTEQGKKQVAGENMDSLVSVTMTSSDFALFSRFIQNRCGIKMPDVKKTMLESRLRKRLRHLGFRTFREYWNFLNTPMGMASEYGPMIDEVTTNKTDFFREPAHFEYLLKTAVPDLIHRFGAGTGRPLKVWSAGCSSGEEPYTLAMVLSDHAAIQGGFRFRVMATDISAKVLEKARRAIYDEDKVEGISAAMKKNYLMRSRDRNRGKVRLVPEIRSLVEFSILNFLDADYGIRTPFDAIFCRNVLIYFEREIQRAILLKILRHLIQGGYLFTGHSETLHALNLPVELVAPSVYRKVG